MENKQLQLFFVTLVIRICLSVKAQESGFSNVSATGPNFPVDIEKFPGELCLRKCDNSMPRICYFNWVMEYYHAMGPACKKCADGVLEDCYSQACLTADGIERGVMSINRQIPGPKIQVCKDDLIVVDVKNSMGGTAATIHWHGPHQRATPHMDGVPFITQCPIEFATTFRYSFFATQAGTQFYHSHTGHHKVNGHYGAMIIREPLKDDPNSQLYGHDLPEHTIIVSDWMHQDAEMFVPGLPTRPGGIGPDNLLINGRGRYNNSGKITKTPLEVFRVQQGESYRFRFINSASHACPLQLQVENHRLEIIASDSYPLKPKVVDTLLCTSGERYDFIIRADMGEGDYWIRLRSSGSCTNRQIEQFAVLSYRPNSVKNIELAIPVRPTPKFNEVYQDGVFVNHPNTTCYNIDTEDECIADFEAYTNDPEVIESKPDYQFFLGYNTYAIAPSEIFAQNNHDNFMNVRGGLMLMGAVNNISFTFPPFSLLTQPEKYTENIFCDEHNRLDSCRNRQICPCVHRKKVKLNSIVELVIVDETPSINTINHPFHLHGYKLYVVGMGQNLTDPATVAKVKSLARRKSLVRSDSMFPPMKDTVSIPSKGYTIVRFKADNPGFWLMHCHFEWHMAVGMGLVWQVGEPADMIKPPKGFPKCDNFLPDIDASILIRPKI